LIGLTENARHEIAGHENWRTNWQGMKMQNVKLQNMTNIVWK